MKEWFLNTFSKENFSNLFKTLRYSLYVITHPLDGFWDLNHERRGSVGAATVIILMMVLTNLLRMQYSSFLFVHVRWSRVNLAIQIAGVLAPVLIGVVANWSITTLMDGKGTMKDIYMAAGYSLTPYVLINLPLILLSNVITVDEGSFYEVFEGIALVWVGLLLMSAMMMIHDYSLLKALFAAVITVVGMMIIVFLILLFFSLISDAIAYFVSLYKELSYRLY
ncbi:MAG: YIP1 family protein [Lachnospiraceae bacterium]|nr:YIP1 family protein [Lachnospiraceae bacterium]